MSEPLEIVFAGESEAGEHTVILRGSREAVKDAARLFGEPVQIVLASVVAERRAAE